MSDLHISDTELCDVSISGMLRTQREYYEAKLAEEIEISNQRGNHIEFVLLPQMSDLQFQLKDVEAKLAKAMESLERIKNQPDYRLPSPQDIARTTIEELKEES
ncbi:hypothetical protein N9Z41_02775 [bacterium]|nr:hypothetical protein [bacterium]